MCTCLSKSYTGDPGARVRAEAEALEALEKVKESVDASS